MPHDSCKASEGISQNVIPQEQIGDMQNSRVLLKISNSSSEKEKKKILCRY